MKVVIKECKGVMKVVIKECKGVMKVVEELIDGWFAVQRYHPCKKHLLWGG